jgi:2-iminobutanoate/2-iminopropanoate deaminase
MTTTRINPESLHTSPYYAQGVLTEGGRTLYVGGQNGTDKNGELREGLAAQSAQAARNVAAVVEAAGGAVGDIVKLTVILRAGEDLNTAYQSGVATLPGLNSTVTVMTVAGLALPGALVEIEAIAHVE